MDEAREYYAKWKKSEKDKYMISLMWNLRNKTDEHMGRGRKKEKKGKQTAKDLTIQNKLSWRRRRVGDGLDRSMGIKEGTCDEHWVLYVSDESLNSTPETNIILYVNYLDSK